ncbi:hypothetical protein NC652_024369 [Populus alba x Populus x berolinensis]|nr:hypothetical protein NC652_024369 [Populus alba x Populus x berolinensis]
MPIATVIFALDSINATLDLMPVTIQKVLSHQSFLLTTPTWNEYLSERSWAVRRLESVELRFLQMCDIKRFCCNCEGWAAFEFTVCLVQVRVMEEVSIWGWPSEQNMQGLLKTEFSSRSFIVLSGRVTETVGLGNLRESRKKPTLHGFTENWAETPTVVPIRSQLVKKSITPIVITRAHGLLCNGEYLSPVSIGSPNDIITGAKGMVSTSSYSISQ